MATSDKDASQRVASLSEALRFFESVAMLNRCGAFFHLLGSALRASEVNDGEDVLERAEKLGLPIPEFLQGATVRYVSHPRRSGTPITLRLPFSNTAPQEVRRSRTY
jgi:hypothetical protein